MTPQVSLQREALIAWYAGHARSLPWRTSMTPYRVLVSEFMLQQTRVDSVIAYFERFMARFPSVEDLATASVDDVLRLWSGLGYYRRARYLHAAAKQIVNMGAFPDCEARLRALPGVGPYTAAAVASIAFGQPVAAIDGNVRRVISRIDGITTDYSSAETTRRITARVQALTTDDCASELTQGLMELGALVCTPRTPRCEQCPWSWCCEAHKQGCPTRYPVKAARAAPEVRVAVAAIWECADRGIWMGQRPVHGLLGGMWEPILQELAEGQDHHKALSTLLLRSAGVALQRSAYCGEVRHLFTHRDLRVHVYRVWGQAQGCADPWYDAVGWVRGQDDAVALSSLARRIMAVAATMPLTGV